MQKIHSRRVSCIHAQVQKYSRGAIQRDNPSSAKHQSRTKRGGAVPQSRLTQICLARLQSTKKGSLSFSDFSANIHTRFHSVPERLRFFFLFQKQNYLFPCLPVRSVLSVNLILCSVGKKKGSRSTFIPSSQA